jgi:DedD protein
MAADSTSDQELALKKRARRRLVGAIALVLLMVIVLPMVLQDRTALAPQDAIKISMPADALKSERDSVIATAQPANPEAIKDSPVIAEQPIDTQVEAGADKETIVTNDMNDKPPPDKAEAKLTDTKTKEPKKVAEKMALKPIEQKPTDEMSIATGNASFTIQVGVFSDQENVKQLQAKLKQAGLTSRTEKIVTTKGEKIRLRAGNFGSRQEAAYALTKLNEAGLSGMVISYN